MDIKKYDTIIKIKFLFDRSTFNQIFNGKTKNGEINYGITYCKYQW